jgi:hypothetical protein
MKYQESVPLEGNPDRPYIESRRLGYIWRDRFLLVFVNANR